MVKLVDTLDLGSSIFTDMGVQIPLPAHKTWMTKMVNVLNSKFRDYYNLVGSNPTPGNVSNIMECGNIYIIIIYL